MIDYNVYKEKLLRLKDELEALEKSSAESRAPVELDQTTQGRLSRMDAMQQQAMALEMDRRRQDHISRINHALEMIKSEDYGYCVRCDEEIQAKRLDLDPAIFTCIKCAG